MVQVSTPPVPRSPKLAFTEVPRHWFAGNVAATQVANAVNLLFPAGERFFVRSVKHYMHVIEEDPELLAQVKGFFGQEGRHANAHERFFDAMRGQGLQIDDILARYEHDAYDVIEKKSPALLALAVTVALEHFTAILAEDALDGGILEHVDPEMRRLLSWHAVEELEHKAVAFDVLRKVNPSYALRIAGLAMASAVFAGFWMRAARDLLAQEGMTLRQAGRSLKKLRAKGLSVGISKLGEPVFRKVFVDGIRGYLKPGFHPNDKDHRATVARALARLRSEGVVETAS